MATVTLKQEISTVLKDVLLKVCQKITPFTEQLELHGLLLLETDGQEFCTVTFKDAKVTKGSSDDQGNDPVETDCGQKAHREVPALCLMNGKRNSCELHPEDDAAVKHGLISVAVQDAIDLWQGIKTSSQTGSDDEELNNNTISQTKSGSIDEIIRTYENKKRSWTQMTWKREKNENNKYECPFCYREFSHATNLTRHQRTHHGRPKIRKPRPNQTADKKSKDSNMANPPIPEAAALEGQQTVDKNAENMTDKENNCQSYNQADNTNVQSSCLDVNISSDNPQINYSDTSKNTQSFLAQNSDFAGQSSVGIELSNSYMQTEFLTDDVYFGIADADSAPETTPRIVPLHPDNVNTSDSQEFIRINNNNNNANPMVLTESYMSLPVSLDNPRDVTTQTLTDANTKTTAATSDSSTDAVGTVFKTKAGKEYVSITNTDSRQLVHSCPLCQRKFDFYQNLGRHVSVSHGISIFELEMQQNQSSDMQLGSSHTDDDKKRFKCELCGHMFSFRSNLSRHKSKHHGANADQERVNKQNGKKTTNEVNAENQDLPKPDQAKYKCDICGGMFTFTSSLSRHMRKKHSLVRADLYKTSRQMPSKEGKQTNISLTKGSAENNPLSNSTKTNQAEFAIPLTSYLPYGVSNIIQSNMTGITLRDSRSPQGHTLLSMNENKQNLSGPSLNSTEPSPNNDRRGSCPDRLPSADNINNLQKANIEDAQKEKDSVSTDCIKTSEPNSGSSIPENSPASDKKTESDRLKSSRKLPSERYRHKCSICNQMFTFRTNLTRHTRKIHRTCPDFPPESAPSAS